MSAVQITPQAAAVAVGVLVIGGLIYKASTGLADAGSAAATSVKSGDAVRAAGDTIANNVKAAGEQVGIPNTSNEQCEIDLANGDMWAASFSCPAGRYLEAVTSKVFK